MRIWLVVFVLACLSPGVRATRSDQELEEFTRAITEELRASHPEAVEAFEQANAARERGAAAEAERLYRAVLAEAPDFLHAQRRLCGVIAEQGRREEALKLARALCSKAPGSDNHAALLAILTAAPSLSPAETAEVRALTRKLMSDRSAGTEHLLRAAQGAVTGQDLELLRTAVARLLQLAPEDHRAHYFAIVEAMTVGDEARAEAELAEALRLGMPAEVHASLAQALEEQRPLPRRALQASAWVLGGWCALFLVLLGLGVYLSHAALRAAERKPERASGEFTGLDRTLRSAYRYVLWLSCAFYYVSLPLVLVVVVGLGGALLYGFWELGRIPVKLVLPIGAIVVVTAWAMLKSLVIAAKDEDPGERLDLEAHPRLRELLDEVAEAIGTRPVDSVYLTPGTDVAVFERGGLWRQLRGETERCLILGVGVLDGFTLGPLRAVLAHEYGHFQNRDTAGGGLALAVRRSLYTMAHGLATGGAATGFNPAWLFLNGFHRVFMRISQGASRLQEVMADRWAAFAYGAENFERGLRHVIARSVRFSATANLCLRAAAEKKTVPQSVYVPWPVSPEIEGKIEQAIEATIEAEPSPYDSHPSPRDRFAWVAALDAPASNDPDDERPAWELFEERAELEQHMTRQLLKQVRVARR